MELFPGTAQPPIQSNKDERPLRSVTSIWPRNINLVPIDYAFRPRLRGRLTLFRLALNRNPLDFRRECLSHSLSLLMSSFSTSDLSTGSLTGRLHRKLLVSNSSRRKIRTHGTMSHYALLPCNKCILSFGSWFEPRYIFRAGQLIYDQ